MNVPIVTLIYAAVLHIGSIAGLIVLLCLGKGPADAEWALLTALVTAGLALPVNITPVGKALPPAPVVAPVVVPPAA